MILEVINYENKKNTPEIKLHFENSIPNIKKENLQLINKLRFKLYQPQNRDLLLKLRHYNLYEQYDAMLNQFKESNITEFKTFSDVSDLLNLIQLSINDYELQNIKSLEKITTESEVIYTLNFEFGLFDSLQKSTINILEKIYNESKESEDYKYINQNIWIQYAKNYAETISLENNITITNILKTDYIPTVKSHNPQEGILYEDTILNEEQLLYSFLGILFSCNKINPIIKKCKNCGKFFITHKRDTLNCNRIDYKGNSCKQKAIRQSKAIYQNKFISIVEKKIRDLYKNEEYIYERNLFTEEYKLKRKTLSGKEYLYWLINHYKKDDSKQKMKTKIDEYIKNTPNFEEEFSKYYKH